MKKVTPNKKDEIQQLVNQGINRVKIAEELKVSVAYVSEVKKNMRRNGELSELAKRFTMPKQQIFPASCENSVITIFCYKKRNLTTLQIQQRLIAINSGRPVITEQVKRHSPETERVMSRMRGCYKFDNLTHDSQS